MDLNNILQQAQALKSKFEEKKQQFDQRIFTGKAGGGLVTVELKGSYKIETLNIDAQTLKDDPDLATDLIKAAFNNATEQLADAKSELMPEQMSGMGDLSKLL